MKLSLNRLKILTMASTLATIITIHMVMIAQTVYASVSAPCFVFDSDTQLRDLSPLIRTDGTSYKVDSSKFAHSVRDLHINVCNDADDKCGPSVSACFTDTKLGQTVEIGYSNSSHEIEWDAEHDSVITSYVGQLEPSSNGTDKRRHTLIRFICPKEHLPARPPKLVEFNETDSLIEWYTVHACPRQHLEVHATACQISGFGVDINIRDLSYNQDKVLVEDININGTSNKMLISICAGLKKNKCGNYTSQTTAACLITKEPAKQSPVGNVLSGKIHLYDTMVVLDYPGTELCQPSTVGQNRSSQISRTISTRIEYTCDPRADNIVKPKFVKFENCAYVFAWPSRHLCREMAVDHNCNVKVNDSYSLDLRDIYRGDSADPWLVKAASSRMKIAQIRLNVCGLLNHDQYKQHCDYSSSICLIDPPVPEASNATQTFANVSSSSSINLGIYKNATFDPKSNKITLLYTDGSPLNSSDPLSPRRNTTISLECGSDRTAPPKLLTTDFSSATTRMTWRHPVACLADTTPRPPKRPLPLPPAAANKTTSKPAAPAADKNPVPLPPPAPSTGTANQSALDSGHQLHKDTQKEAQSIVDAHTADEPVAPHHSEEIQSAPQSKPKAQQPDQSGGGAQLVEGAILDERSHRFLMVSLIIFSFVSCAIVIFIIHNKTRIPRSLREFRMTREHQSPQFSYRRVFNNGENGSFHGEF